VLAKLQLAPPGNGKGGDALPVGRMVARTTSTTSTTMTTKKTSKGGSPNCCDWPAGSATSSPCASSTNTRCVSPLASQVQPPRDGVDTLGICQDATGGQQIVWHSGEGADEADDCWGGGSCWRRGGGALGGHG
jgi:hypothetical protein